MLLRLQDYIKRYSRFWPTIASFYLPVSWWHRSRPFDRQRVQIPHHCGYLLNKDLSRYGVHTMTYLCGQTYRGLETLPQQLKTVFPNVIHCSARVSTRTIQPAPTCRLRRKVASIRISLHASTKLTIHGKIQTCTIPDGDIERTLSLRQPRRVLTSCADCGEKSERAHLDTILGRSTYCE